MKKINMLVLTAVFAAATFAVQTAWAATQTLDGVVSDSMCGKKHMMPGKSDAQCVQECIKAGSKYVLVSGSKVYTMSATAATLAPFAGKHVRVQGELKSSTLAVESIHESSAR